MMRRIPALFAAGLLASPGVVLRRATTQEHPPAGTSAAPEPVEPPKPRGNVPGSVRRRLAREAAAKKETER